MLYCGWDVHCKQIATCTLDNDGKVLGRWTVRRLDQMMPEGRMESLRFRLVFDLDGDSLIDADVSGYGLCNCDYIPNCRRTV